MLIDGRKTFPPQIQKCDECAKTIFNCVRTNSFTQKTAASFPIQLKDNRVLSNICMDRRTKHH